MEKYTTPLKLISSNNITIVLMWGFFLLLTYLQSVTYVFYEFYYDYLHFNPGNHPSHLLLNSHCHASWWHWEKVSLAQHCLWPGRRALTELWILTQKHFPCLPQYPQQNTEGPRTLFLQNKRITPQPDHLPTLDQGKGKLKAFFYHGVDHLSYHLIWPIHREYLLHYCKIWLQLELFSYPDRVVKLIPSCHSFWYISQQEEFTAPMSSLTTQIIIPIWLSIYYPSPCVSRIYSVSLTKYPIL